MAHQYKLGQRVRQSRESEAADRNARGDTYEVVRLMPEDRGGNPCYRIKSPSGERAVSQADIVPA
jgi:hypothetical protein